ncbi:hypothetical protein MMC25_002278 [Agyrium rufum]|nr:hypothetical protein [Agyrium rufum]
MLLLQALTFVAVASALPTWHLTRDFQAAAVSKRAQIQHIEIINYVRSAAPSMASIGRRSRLTARTPNADAEAESAFIIVRDPRSDWDTADALMENESPLPLTKNL